MTQSIREDPDLTSCDREPIRVPGAIQPHGLLFVLREADLVITQTSENVQALLGVSPGAVLAQSVAALLDSESAVRLREALCATSLDEANPLPLVLCGRSFDGICHRHQGVTILELEQPAAERPFHHTLRGALARIQASDTALDELGAVVVQEVKRLTEFHRVMIYKFADEGHGSVVAEAVDPGYEPYLGLHYPASDIPQQARQLYLQNWLRIIPDALYTPARLIAADGLASDAPLDLSFAFLRSVSPVHLEYMRNMGVTASMSISIITRGRLWGLIACVQHRGPRHLDYVQRAAAEVIGRLTSVQIAALQEHEVRDFRGSSQGPLDELEGAMRMTQGEVLAALTEHSPALLSLVRAAGAAICTRDECVAVGDHPGEREIVSIGRFLDANPGAVFSSASLAGSYPEAAAWKDTASGLLAISLPGTPARRVMWFRPEELQSMSWSGNPDTSKSQDSDGRLHPRRSFEQWKAEVRLRSRSWTAGELDAALELRRRAIETDLVKQLEREQRAVLARDDLLAVVSHDLKNPISTIKLQASAWLRADDLQNDTARPLRKQVERLQRIVDGMDRLVDNLLDQANIEAGRFKVDLLGQDASEILEEAATLFGPLADKKGIALTIEATPNQRIMADRARILQVLSNLIGNAAKFAPQGGTIRVSSRPLDDEVLFAVADDGPGIPADELPHIFVRYWQARREVRVGSGLGLYIVKGIVDAHGGRIWIESAPGSGATFYFTLRSPQGAQVAPITTARS